MSTHEVGATILFLERGTRVLGWQWWTSLKVMNSKNISAFEFSWWFSFIAEPDFGKHPMLHRSKTPEQDQH